MPLRKKTGLACLTSILFFLLLLSGCRIRLATEAERAGAGSPADSTPTSAVTTVPPSPSAAAPTADPTEAPSFTRKPETPSVSSNVPLPPQETPTVPDAPARETARPEPEIIPEPAAQPGNCFTVSIVGPESELLSSRAVTYPAEEEITAFQLLERICRQEGLALEYAGSVKRKTVYVTGIAGIFEKDHGAGSGWTYRINDQLLSIGASAYQMKNGDHMEWKYIRE